MMEGLKFLARSNQPPSADDIFDNVSSDSSSDDCQYSFDESNEEICHNGILANV